MSAPQAPDPVKLFVALLWADAEARDQSLAKLQHQWGMVDIAGPDRLFDVTDYYVPEMGVGLKRRIVAFQRLVPPEALVEAKLICNRMEEELAGPAGRRANLDVGYLDHNKVLLASAKGAGQKVYLGSGIWADLVGRYAAGRYQPFEWTFPDFRDGRYDEELGQIRRTYLEQLRELKDSRS